MRAIRRDLKEEYNQEHKKPWIIGFSGGKDSTLLLQLVFEAILATPPAERQRRVHVVTNDTLVESPVVSAYVEKTVARLRAGVEALGVPVTVAVTTPDLENTFWVNLLGRGYPAPNRHFRWCTDRMKIRPTTRYLLETVDEAGEAILLVGTRRAESANRAQTIARYGERLSAHASVPRCLVYKPIVDLGNDEVWLALQQCRPPWGGTHHEVVTLYKSATGECPFVTSKDDAPSCGSSSVRFGCWTCTVVEKDRSLDALIDAGFGSLELLSGFRNRLKEISGTPEHRSKTRRSGQPGLGPLTLEARALLLAELEEIQARAGLPLVSEAEVRRIREIWREDTYKAAMRAFSPLRAHLERAEGGAEGGAEEQDELMEGGDEEVAGVHGS